MNRQTKRGEMGLATSKNGLKWRHRKIVQFEPFHLSYPYVFEWQGGFYMTPETHEPGSIRLYKATQFPVQWSFVETLLSGQPFKDASVFRHNVATQQPSV